MSELIRSLLLQVEGMNCDGCVDAITRAVRQLDEDAVVEVDLDHGRVHITTRAESLEVAAALNAAGYEARVARG